MHYYQFNIGDYTSHTAHLDPVEDAAYRRMIDHYYLHEKPLPGDVDKIAKLIRMREHCKCIADVLDEFFTLSDDGYIHQRIESEIKSYHALSRKRKKAANKRWANQHKGLSGDASALQDGCTSNANHEPRTRNQEPETKNQSKPAPRKRGPVLLSTYLQECEKENKKPIPEDCAVFDYAADVSIPESFLVLVWKEFKERNMARQKKYKSWPQAFCNCVREDWYKLWYVDSAGDYQLTSKGKQAEKMHGVVYGA